MFICILFTATAVAVSRRRGTNLLRSSSLLLLLSNIFVASPDTRQAGWRARPTAALSVVHKFPRTASFEILKIHAQGGVKKNPRPQVGQEGGPREA